MRYRGTGQGNISADPTPYVDGEIVRSGPVGDQGDGAYSAGVRLLAFRECMCC